MSDKNLLNESTVRRFMKLAKVDTLTDNFISEMGKAYKKEKEEVEEAAVLGKRGAVDDEVAEGAMYDDDDALEEEVDIFEQDEDMPEDDMDEDPMADAPAEMDMEMGDVEEPMGEADMSLTEEEAQLLIDLGERLKEAMGAGDEPEMADEPEEMDEPEAEEGPALEDEPEEEEEDPALQQEIVNEVLKRVTQRIIREKMKRK